MPAVSSESLILRTYPSKESDLVVSFFTRDEGKLRGYARAARKPKSRFGASLERLSYTRVYYVARENRELFNLTSADLIQSQFAISRDYEAGVALDFVAEVSDLLLPAHEVNERFFRLLLAVLADLRGGGSPWRAVLYTSVWAVRLAGLLGEPMVAPESRDLAIEILSTPIGSLASREWAKTTARDLRRWLIRDIETHAERRIQSAAILESL
ncbi:MAG: DNA repair protein RecO [Bryobacteraceae bacterium]|nr:DNA repair protein RecO [Bryobacteraceae bacterium]